MPRYFLLKINAGNCPNGIGQPNAPDQWENGDFQVKALRKSRWGHNAPVLSVEFPSEGDEVLVWVSETNGGAGLSARSKVAFGQAEKKILRLNDIQLMPFPRLVNSDLIERPFIRADAREAIHPFSREEWENILDRARAKSKNIQNDQVEGKARRPAPTEVELAQWQAQRQKSLRLTEMRSNQGPFRDALLKRYRKCAVTGWGLEAVLEAAHLIPQASRHPDRDNIENGILLRADIHTLMDRCLL